MICKHTLPITLSNEPELIFGTHLNGFKYCYEIVTIQHLSLACTRPNRYAYMICKFASNFIFK